MVFKSIRFGRQTKRVDENDEVAFATFDLYIRWENNNIDIDWLD